MRPIVLAFGLAVVVWLTTGCDSNNTGDTKACIPNTTLICDCLGGTQGVQSCVHDGSGYSVCDCGVVPGPDTVDSPDGTSEGCTEGATQEGTTVCGFNGEGVLTQDCVDGVWQDNQNCTGTDECTNGEAQEGATSCGLYDFGVLTQDCFDGVWVDVGPCTSNSFLVIHFNLTLEVGPLSVGSAEVFATFESSYYTEEGVLLCREQMEVTGEAVFGATSVPDCPNCTGLLHFDETSLVNVTDPTSNPDHCVGEFPLSRALLQSQQEGGLGDFLTIALVDVATMNAHGLNLYVDDSISLSETISGWADNYGLEFTHAAYINNQPDTWASMAELDAIAASAGDGSPWLAYWAIGKDPEANTYEGSDLSGLYIAESLWMTQFNPIP